MKVASTSPSSDRWAWRPTACTVAVAAFFVFVGALPGPLNLPLMLLAVATVPAATLLLVGSTCVFAWRGRPCLAGSTLSALVAPVLLLIPMVLAQPYVHLALMLAFGIGYIGPAPIEGRPVAVYDWSTGMVGGPNTFLIRDATDAVASSQASGGPSTWPRALETSDLLKDCAGRVEHLVQHYYVCSG